MIFLMLSFVAGVLMAVVFEHGLCLFQDQRAVHMRKYESALIFWCIAGVSALVSAVHPLGLVAAVPVALSHIDLAKHHEALIGWQDIIRNIGNLLRRASRRFR